MPHEESSMALNAKSVAGRLPAKDLERARQWYAEMLDLHPAEERPGALLYVIGNGEFAIFQSAGKSDGSFTQLAITVADVNAAAAQLRARGVVLEEYDTPPLVTHDGIADIEGNYPSKGKGERACWFRDCEGNMIGMAEAIR
jgi:catechol 2,3-dioxygenase-like lactoylglutathione lyase family enzyme